jgi:Domain of unknown function (DUF2017)
MARVVRDAGGARRWTLQLPPLEARLIAGLPDKLQALLTNPGQNRRVVDRLFPPGYRDESEAAEHRHLLGETLLDARREMLTAVRALLAAGKASPQGLQLALDEPAVDALLRCVNDARLIIATDLDIRSNLGDVQVPPGHPDAARYSLLVYLGGLEQLLLEAVSEA